MYIATKRARLEAREAGFLVIKQFETWQLLWHQILTHTQNQNIFFSFSETECSKRKPKYLKFNSNWKKLLGFRNMQEKLENCFGFGCVWEFGVKVIAMSRRIWLVKTTIWFAIDTANTISLEISFRAVFWVAFAEKRRAARRFWIE